MDTFVASIRSMSGDPAKLGELHRNLTQSGDNLKNAPEDCLRGVASLNLEQHTLGATHLLAAVTQSIKIMGVEEGNPFQSTFIKLSGQMLLRANPEQVRFAAKKFAEVCRMLASLVLVSKNPMAVRSAVAPLRAAVDAVSPSRTSVTPVHVDLLQVCLKAKMYHVAAALLKRPMTDVGGGAFSIVPDGRDMQHFFYYAGLVYVGLRQYKDARDCFLQVLTVPAEVATQMCVEARRKFILTSLLASGELRPLPHCVPNCVSGAVDRQCESYLRLAKAFTSTQAGGLEGVMRALEEGGKAWLEDRTLGLVQRVVEQWRRQQIQRLTHTYLTLPLSHIAKAAGLTGPAQAEQYIVTMVEAGEVFATINASPGSGSAGAGAGAGADLTVSFHEDPETYSSEDSTLRLHALLEGAAAVAGRLREMEDEVLQNRDYVARTTPVGGDSRRGGGQ